jgi:sulfonate transport system permease protein
MAQVFKKREIPAAYIPLGFLLPAVLLLSWQLLTKGKHALIGTPMETIKVFSALIMDGTILKLTLVSLERVLKGFAIGTVLGMTSGIFMGSSKQYEKFIATSFHAMRQIPMVAWVPVLIMWFGTGGLAQVVFISWAAFYPSALNAYDGIKNIPKKYLEISKVYGYTKFQTIKHIIIPAALPNIKTGIILSLNIAWTLLVAAEIMTSEPSGGLGNILSEGRETFNMQLLITGMIVMGTGGFFINKSAELIWDVIFKNNTGREAV